MRARPQRSRSPNFYPRPPRGGRPAPDLADDVGTQISIHALREEGEQQGFHLLFALVEFLSTPSARRATAGAWDEVTKWQISIHALREEGDRPLEEAH